MIYLSLSPPAVDAGNRAEAALAEILGLVPGGSGQALLQEGSTSILASMSHAINGAALLAATVLVLWSSLSAIANTAHEGVLFGYRYDSLWTPLRSVLAISMLLPLVNGYSLVQTAVILLAQLGFKSADLAWQEALKHLQDSGPVITVSPSRGTALTEALFKSNLCMLRLNSLYLDGEQTLKIVAREDEGDGSARHNHYQLSFDGVAGYGLGRGKCGEFTLTHERGPIGDTMHEGSKTALRRLSVRLNTTARNVLGGTLSGREAARQLRQARARYTGDIQTASDRALKHGEHASDQSSQQFFNSAQEQGWMMAGAWFWARGAVNRRIADTVQNSPGIKLPNPENMPSDWQLALSQDLLRAERTIISKIHRTASVEARAEGFGGLHNKIVGWSHQAMTQALNYVNQLFDSTGEPVVALQSFGHGIINVAELMITEAISGQAAGSRAQEGRGTGAPGETGALSPGGTLDFLHGVGNSMLQWASLLIVVLAAPVLLSGLILAFWLPAIPFVYWFAGIISWLLGLLETLFVAPLWAAAHAGAEGHGLGSYWGRAGYVPILALVARPLMMVLALFSAMLVVRYGSQFLLHTFTPFARGLHAQTLTGMISIIVMLLLLTALVVIMVNRAYALIHVLPNTLLRYIGGVPGSTSSDEFAHDMRARLDQGPGVSRPAIIQRGDETGSGTPEPVRHRDADALLPGTITVKDFPDNSPGGKP